MTTYKAIQKHSSLTAEYLAICKHAREQEQSRSLATSDNWAHVDKAQVHQDWDSLYKELAPLVAAADQPDDAQVQSMMARHYAIAARFYVPSREAYVGLGVFYQEDPSMREFHNAYHPQMAEFLRDAICVYALAKL
ncbi:TipAS antibiotic-recognition domain-containing protein [Hydrogenophaga taeniospiralis]|uniref:TipAS antibiotic-recognition domain-containing protein n=1 Tax=Hydrogenophaga taeniospiralis TaxID=65656 RepID=UPI001CFB878A|nr:TipAS antibiotic-recognition domain-containing protein [Hydrogenophaga taeniospiralis]